MTGYTVVACILWSLGEGRPLSAALGLVRVDGLDASSIVSGLVARLGALGAPVMLDSVTIAGFNVVSPMTVERLTGSPVIFVYKYRPNAERLGEGLRAAGLPFSGLRERVIRFVVERVRAVETKRGTLYMFAWGLSIEDAVKLVEASQERARMPEVLRAAHYTASEASRLLLASRG
jgi:endonuclease V-like protein UPF0215 family